MFRKMSINLTAVTLTILRFLAQDPDSSFHGREIAEKTGVSSGAASITLRVLEGSGLLEMEEKGRMKFYRFNLSNPVSREFKVLFNISREVPNVSSYSVVVPREEMRRIAIWTCSF